MALYFPFFHFNLVAQECIPNEMDKTQDIFWSGSRKYMGIPQIHKLFHTHPTPIPYIEQTLFLVYLLFK